MIIQKLYEERVLELDSLLTKEQKRLKLTPNELVVLKALFQMYKRRTFSINQIARKIELSSIEIGKAVEKLETKGFVSFYLDTIKDKQVEVFDLTNTFKKVTELYEADLREKNFQLKINNISQTIKMIEDVMGKNLSAYELEMIKSWYEEELYPHEEIIEKIEENKNSGRFSIKFIERLLNRNKLMEVKPDDKVDKVLDKIFKAIK